jgi:hypothetical protein
VNWYKTAKNDKEFLFDELEKTIWGNLLGKEQDRVSISFNTENNDSIGDIKEKKLDINTKTPGASTLEYKVLVQMFSAGGDWENPVTYFKCQSSSKNVEYRNWRLDGTFIYIPSKKEGNLNLVKKEDGFCASQDSEGVKSQKVNESQLWKSLVKHCNKRLKDYHKAQYKDYDPDVKKIEEEYGIYGMYNQSRLLSI